MFPTRCPDDVKSAAEHDVFEMLRDGLSPEWTCLHSLGLARHDRKVWAEIDFVAIGPEGVYCLEVKGGQVAREDGVWIFRNRHGHETRKAEGPFAQVGSASGALKGFFRKNRRSALRSVFGFGVVMPDICFRGSGPDVDIEVVLDKEGVPAGIKRYFEMLSETWRLRFRAQHGAEPKVLSREERDSIVELLRGDFDLVPSLPTRLGWIVRDLVRLTSEQGAVLARLGDNPGVLVRGGAGSGKTLLALEEARRASDQGKRVLFLCFNRLLAAALARSAGAGVTVSTIHAYMAHLIHAAGLDSELPRDADRTDIFELFFPALSLQALALPGRPARFDMVVVDEAQDVLLPDYLEVLDELLVGGFASGRWRMFYDPNQNIFDGICAQSIEQLLSYHPTQYELTVNCRSTEQIATATAMISGCAQLETATQGPDVELLWYRGASEQRRAVSNYVGRLLSQGARPSDIVILSTRSLRNSALAGGWYGAVGATLSEVSAAEPGRADAIRFSTIGAYKGLESDIVVLMDVVAAERESIYLAYVGASRARALLAILLDRDRSDEFMKRVSAFAGVSMAVGTK